MQPPPPPSVPKINNAQELTRALEMTLMPDTRALQLATEMLKQYMKKPASVYGMIEQIQQATNPFVRQQAAIQLRQKIDRYWIKLPAAAQAQIRQQLWQFLVREDQRSTRAQIGRVIAVIARGDLPAHRWDNLLRDLQQLSQSPQPAHREISMMLFRALAESLGPLLKPFFQVLQQIFCQALQDPQPEVRLQALRALDSLVVELDDDRDLRAFTAALDPLVNVARQCVQSGDEAGSMAAIEVFETLAGAPPAALSAHLVVVVRFALELICIPTLDINLREAAANILYLFLLRKPKALTKLKLVPELLRAALTVIMEPVSNESSQSIDTGDVTPQKLGVELVNYILSNINHVQPVFEQALGAALQILEPTAADATAAAAASGAPVVSSYPPHQRRGALLLMATLVESCDSLMIPILARLLNVLARSTNDPDWRVREAACIALTQFADHCRPEILQFHQVSWSLHGCCLTLMPVSVLGATRVLFHHDNDNPQNCNPRPLTARSKNRSACGANASLPSALANEPTHSVA